MSEEINITPRNNSFLLGQIKAEELFLKAWKKQTMHHAWILNSLSMRQVAAANVKYR